jgi:serine/threonine protein kinase
VSANYESFGKYVLLEKLATGGMAEVFLGRGTGAGGIGKFFAVKRILPQYADSPEFIEMFKDEAKIAINLSHSNIVSIHEFGVEKGQFFLVMDYVEGRNLRQILNKMKKSALQYSIDQIVYIIKEVASGLDHAHRCIDGSTGKPLNINHRDMSPQNVMVSFEGEVKIVDFGIAKAESQIENTRAGTLKGKFGYMSPEQAEGQPVDLRTDIFSLGIVLWELLANDRLFVANNEINTLRKIRDCQIPSLRKINPNIHTELERICQKALARDRNLRYQTAAALHRDLNRFLNRQYPEFSSQDFAVFIKSVFADEILSLRKRLVEYSKVNLSIDLSIPKLSDHDRTSLTDSGESSFVLSDSEEEDNGDTGPHGTIRIDSDLVDIPSRRLARDRLADTDMTHTDTSQPGLTKSKQPILPPAPTQVTANSLLDENALARANSAGNNTFKPVRGKVQPLETKADSPIETEEVSSPSIRHGNRAGKHRSGTHARILLPKNNSAHRPARFATLMVFTLLCLGVYSYLVKYFPVMMAPVVKVTDPLLGPIHEALIDRRFIASPSPPQVPLPTSTTGEESNPGSRLNRSGTGLVVQSNPSGAEIYLNQKSTGLQTPTRVEVPADTPFTVTIKKRGYQDFILRDVTRDSLGMRVDAVMQKLNVAYVDVEIFPPQEAVLYVNGRVVPVYRNVAKDVMIPGDTPVKIRAESRSFNSFDEMTILVNVDKKKSYQLNPRKIAKPGRNTANQ